MNRKGQITFEVMAGAGVFLLFFLGVAAYASSETTILNQESDSITQKGDCFYLSQAFFDAQNNKVKWIGHADYNYYIYHDTIYVNYSPGTPFEGVYCETIDTNLTTTISIGDVNISYQVGSGYLINQ
jgi:hypothetical protein